MIGEMARRFWAKVDKSGSAENPWCWTWTASLHPGGYGRFALRHGKVVYAHRMAYELEIETIPSGLDIDHLCRNRRCVNPAHLEIVTRRENTLRGVGPSASNARKTACPKGHPLIGENVYTAPGKRRRQCATCRAEVCRTRVRRKKAPQ